MKNVAKRSNQRRMRMKRTGLRFPRDLSLFRTFFDEEDEDILEYGKSDALVKMAIARMEFLGSREKFLLSRVARSCADLLAMSSADVQAATLRVVDGQAWTPKVFIEAASRDMEFLGPRGIEFIPLSDCRYPPQLRETYRPPFGLYLRGRLPNPERPCAALVGTRAPSGRGLKAAFALASELSSAGICVVSGLARGIDSAAHRGALGGSGKTVAVLPAGIDAVYPSSNKGLASVIVDKGGALVTEYPPFTEVRTYRFPERNRVIAGLSRSCAVIEAPKKSGALITADHALSEGRDVFVHGACLGGSRDAGCDEMASQGARIVNNAGDILAEWRNEASPLPALPEF